MAGTGTITITGSRIGSNTGGGTFPSASIVNTSAVELTESVPLANGFNALTPPTGSLGMYLLPIGNTQTLTLKGVTGDTGIAISKTNPTVLAFDTSVPTMGITAGAATTIYVIYI